MKLTLQSTDGETIIEWHMPLVELAAKYNTNDPEFLKTAVVSQLSYAIHSVLPAWSSREEYENYLRETGQ